MIFFSVAESVFKRFSGNGLPGYDDGDVGSARFDKPRSFAVDIKGNVYVADRVNKVIRKISTNGMFVDKLCYGLVLSCFCCLVFVSKVSVFSFMKLICDDLNFIERSV